MNFLLDREARAPYSHARFVSARDFVFARWCDIAAERQQPRPGDLSGACKYGSLFVREIFGGVIEGHYAHQFNRVNGRLVDLSHDALDVGRMRNPYLNDLEYFQVPEYHARLLQCMPRVDQWVVDYMHVAGDRG